MTRILHLIFHTYTKAWPEDTRRMKYVMKRVGVTESLRPAIKPFNRAGKEVELYSWQH